MNTIVTLDKAGRVVIPKTVRDALRLAPGDTLALQSDGDRVVLRGGRKLTAAETDAALDRLRPSAVSPHVSGGRERKPSRR